MLKQIHNRTILFFILIILFFILCFGSGYITKQNQINNNYGISFNCYQFLDGIKSCNATINIKSSNETLYLISNFDEIKYIIK